MRHQRPAGHKFSAGNLSAVKDFFLSLSSFFLWGCQYTEQEVLAQISVIRIPESSSCCTTSTEVLSIVELINRAQEKSKLAFVLHLRSKFPLYICKSLEVFLKTLFAVIRTLSSYRIIPKTLNVVLVSLPFYRDWADNDWLEKITLSQSALSSENEALLVTHRC